MTTAPLTVRTFEEAQAVLATNLPGYVRRPHQIGLGFAIETAMTAAEILFAQAGCGTGKSIAALIPAIVMATTPDPVTRKTKRVVIATATKALQQQYNGKDLPFLAEHFPFTYAVLKGRSNYVCGVKARELEFPTPAQRDVIAASEAALKTGEIVDRDSLPATTEREFRDLAMSASECPGASHCPIAKAGKCMAERAKAKAAEADIVVTNIAYLLMDLRLRQMTEDNVQLLGEFDQLIMDEGHNLPEAVTSALSDSIQLGSLVKLAGDVAQWLDEQDSLRSLGDDIGTEARRLWGEIDSIYAEFTRRANGKTDPMRVYAGTREELPETIIGRRMGPGFIALSLAIEAARDEIVRIKRANMLTEEREIIACYRLMRRTEDWMDRIRRYCLDKDTDTVRWIEQENRTYRGSQETQRLLCSAPIEVGGWLRTMIWDKVPAIIMSATLGLESGYLARTMGLGNGEATMFDAGSPFDYAKQAVLFTPDSNQPSPKDGPKWAAWSQQVTRRLVLKAAGDALLLFTSRRAMENAYEGLAGEFAEAGLKVLKQGDMPNGELLATFKQGGAVLFGLKTWMEGVDVPGKALRLVILDKLPFAVPTDILVAARCEAYEKVHGYKKSFGGITIPAMKLTLEQACGRLIRTIEDKGVMAVLDSRLATGYGKQILAALPPARRTSDLGDAEAFLVATR